MATTRQLAAIMFTDMVGYTTLMQENEQLALLKRDRSKNIIESALEKYNGRLLQYYGDGTLSIFSSAVNAILCAVEMQTRNLENPKIDVRIGIHIGDIIFDEAGIYGDSVNVASRIETLAVPGSIFISERMNEEVRNQQDIHTQTLGYFELKNVKQSMQVYAIANPGIVVPSRTEVKGKVREVLNAIAVLPFASLSSDAENEFFCDGITEELINVLAQVDGLQVTSRTSAFAFKGVNEDVREIAGKLNVQKIIEGSVRKAGSKVRITAQLINASDGYHIWSATYDRSLEDIFEVQDEISRAIANKLRENLLPEKHEAPMAIAPTENLEAYKKYLQALINWDSIQMEVRFNAVEKLKEAVALDPEFSAAHALLSVIYSFPGIMGIMDAAEAKRLASYHAGMAIKAQPLNPKAMAAMAIVKLSEWEWQQAFDLLTKANKINPSEPAVYFALGEYYMLMLEYDKAAEVAKRTAEVDPLSARTLAEAGRILIYINSPDEALELAERSLVLNPDNFLAKQLLGYVAYLKGDYQKAVSIFETNHKIAGDHPYVFLPLILSYMKAGMVEKARVIQQQFMAMHLHHPQAGFETIIAYMHLVFSEFEAFYKIFDKAVEEKNTWVIQMYGDSFNLVLRNDTHVKAARKLAGLPVWD